MIHCDFEYWSRLQIQGIYAICVLYHNEPVVVYVGKSQNIAHRIAWHMGNIRNAGQTRRTSGAKYLLLNEIIQNNGNVVFTILEKLPNCDKKTLALREGFYIDKYKDDFTGVPLLNMQKPATYDDKIIKSTKITAKNIKDVGTWIHDHYENNHIYIDPEILQRQLRNFKYINYYFNTNQQYTFQEIEQKLNTP